MENITNQITNNLDGFIVEAANEKNVFNKYMDKEDVAKKIFKELYARFDPKRKGFIMDDNSKSIGLLSQCPSLQALMSLALDFGLDFDDKKIITKQKYSIREIMDMVIEEIIPRIIVKDEAGNIIGYKFDASPYDEESFTVENGLSNIDTITWVIPTFCSVLKYHASLKKPEICQWEDELIAIINYGLKYLDKAFINKPDKKEGLTKGWNFTTDCYEPSLYFSFIVGECYLDVYNTFKDILDYTYNVRNNKDYDAPLDNDKKKTYDEQKTKYDENRNKTPQPRYVTNEDGKKVIKGKYAVHNTYNELVRVFKKINDLNEFEDIRIKNTPYGFLERNCGIVADAVWEYVKDSLADEFFYNNLYDKLSENEIRMSTTSDALFNTVYITNIMIAGGLDETYRLKIQKAISLGSNEAEKLQREYDNLFESCQLAIQKAFRTYEKLKNASKEYIVDQFLIGFNEKFEEHTDLIGNLRKLRMKSFSLLPLLIHSNTVISDYLVQYPQVNMKKYLEYIIENRYYSKKDNKHLWIWEKDGFFSGSNCYFIVALNEFYEYHKKYEETYYGYGKENEKFKKDIIDKYQKELEAPGGKLHQKDEKVTEQEKIIKEQKAEIKELKKQIKEIERPVEDAVKGVVDSVLEEKFEALLCDTFSKASKALLAEEIDATPDTDGSSAKLYNALVDMLFAKILSNYFVVTLQNDKKDYKFTTKNYMKEFEDTKQICKNDINDIINTNIAGLISYVNPNNQNEKKSPITRVLDQLMGEK